MWVLSILIISCNNNSKSTQTEQTKQTVAKVDSNTIGAVGIWSSDFTDSNSTIYLYHKDGAFSTNKIVFEDCSVNKESLKKEGDKYMLEGSDVGDYYNDKKTDAIIKAKKGKKPNM